MTVVSDGRYLMGTVCELSLVASTPERGAQALERAFARIAELEAVLSRYRPESDVSRLNREAGRGEVAVHPDLARVLRAAVAATRETGGAFDVTVGPLVALWVRAASEDAPPGAQALAAARALVGGERIAVSEGRASLPEVGMSVDLGGIAKGFALDRVRDDLEARGAARGLLSFGQSSVWALGAPPDGSGWRLLLRAPDGGFTGVVTLRDRAFSVSSTLGQSSRIGGRRYGHVIDPRTGWAITHELEAAVVAPTATRAETLSTALVVLGPAEGLALVEALPDTEALWLNADGVVQASSGWAAATGFEPLN
ncbi:MAG: FAD:protein FMN transferase [Proteobacteria bacterium]|nr:FAD:protein FMN transferase [Pseudomonadota bacterium]